MAEANPPTHEVLRAKRVELVDDEGRVRAVLGPVHREEGQAVLGLSLHDESGERAWFTTGPSGPDLGMARDGDEVVLLGVVEGPGIVIDGPRFMLLDRRGVPCVDLRAGG